jgi:radical SAM superfamily enzyme YgiQ (UPF0313 family)
VKAIEPYGGFEQGPIRPPSEAGSLLIRITRNCPWNRCSFCPVYKGTRFSLRPVEHVLKDIESVRQGVRRILQAGDREAPFSRGDFFRLLQSDEELDRQALGAAYHFVTNGMRSIFLQDADSLILPPEPIVTILRHLGNAFPAVERVTSYARSRTVARISDENLRRFAEAGLNRIHIGMESGSDTVLKRVKKGTDKAGHILAGQKVKRSGMELSEYYIPGLGGRDLWREHALETADALNRINPDFIRLRTLALAEGTPLAHQGESGEFEKMGEVETARELLLFLESLQGIESTVKSDHALNLFTEVQGKLPQDAEKMTAPIREFLALSPREQMLFCVGRRSGCLTRLTDLGEPLKRRQAEQRCAELGATIENMDPLVDWIMKHYL